VGQSFNEFTASLDCRRHRWADRIECGACAAWLGVVGVLVIGKSDLMYVFWLSSLVRVTGWRSTIPGMMITASSAVINCWLYMAIA
jgi:hypothetical protein